MVAKGISISLWWLLLPAVILLGSALLLYPLRRRRVGYAAFLSLVGCLAWGVLWLASDLGQVSLVVDVNSFQSVGTQDTAEATRIILCAKWGTVTMVGDSSSMRDEKARARRMSRSGITLLFDPDNLTDPPLLPIRRWAPGLPRVQPWWAGIVDWEFLHNPTAFCIGFRIWILLLPFSLLPVIWLFRWRRARQAQRNGFPVINPAPKPGKVDAAKNTGATIPRSH
jgi:uncharacterized membrane protein